MVKNLPANAGGMCSIPGSGRSHGGRMLTGYSSWGCKRVRHEGETEQQQQRECFFLLSGIIKPQHLWAGRETGEVIHTSLRPGSSPSPARAAHHLNRMELSVVY